MSESENKGPQLVLFNERSWFDLDQVIAFNQGFFYGCLERKRDALRKKDIPEEHFVFVSITKKGMSMSTPKYSRAKILISEEWVKNNVPKMMDEPVELQKRSGPKAFRKVSTKRDYRDAPDPIILEDHEIFRDLEGNEVLVDVRGERNEEGIWFRCSDIEKLFEMGNLCDNTTHVLDDGLDYETFLLWHARTNYGHATAEETSRRRVRVVFLSFNGLMRVIYASRSLIAKRYRDWANKICFAGLFGTTEQRASAAADVVGVPTDSLKDVLDICATEVPCVYLFLIGKIVDLRKHYDEFKDRKSGMVFKYGMTKNLLRRCQEHNKTYGSWEGRTFRIAQWVPIHPELISKAEVLVREHLKDRHIQFKNHKELVILGQSEMKEVRHIFKTVFDEFGMSTNEVSNLRHKVNLLENDAVHWKDKAVQFKTDILKKDEIIDELNKTISHALTHATRWPKEKENHEREREHWIKEKATLEARLAEKDAALDLASKKEMELIALLTKMTVR